MNKRYLHVKLCDDFLLRFRLLETPITELWIDRMDARHQYPLDHPDRFYGFEPHEIEVKKATNQIKHCIDTINAYQPVITREFTSINDQDCLNYLHNIFERYHGLLDQQNQSFWNHASDLVRTALAELNIAVHRCELVARGNRPRFVCTWYGLPKIHTVSDHLLNTYGVLNPEFGTVCLNYAEIGKTLEDLTVDNDRYIDPTAFKPFDHYSADFVARFFKLPDQEVAGKIKKMEEYYNQHIDFFHQRGYTTFNHSRLLPYRLPVAVLETELTQDQILKEIQKQQYIKEIYIE